MTTVKAFVLLLTLLFLPAVTAAEAQPPRGWRFPQESDYLGNWKVFRKDLPVPFHIRADFNGDKIIDDAWILIRTDDVGWGLFVFLSQGAGKVRTIRLDNHPNDANPQTMGLGLVQKGEHPTACGKGYWECKRGEPAVLRLKNAGIEYFVYESSSSIFYWNHSANKFKRVAITD
jgi:hypothetical protein